MHANPVLALKHSDRIQKQRGNSDLTLIPTPNSQI
jgi:hypothetical protein